MSSVVNQSPPTHKKPHFPPTVKGRFFFGTAGEFTKNPLTAMIRMQKEYGDALRVHFFAHLYGFLFFHPDHNKHILQDNNRNYTKLPAPTFTLLQPIIGNGLVISDGEFWRRQRRLSQPAFHRKQIANFVTTMTDCTQQMLNGWEMSTKKGQVVDVSEEMMALTLQIAGKTLFSLDLTGQARTVGEAFSRVNQQVSKLNTDPFFPMKLRMPFLSVTKEFFAGIHQLDTVVNRIIQERRTTGQEQEDLLSMLMFSKDEETGESMDDKQLRDEVMTLLIAGHETTAVAMSWALYLLAQQPQVKSRLQDEVEQALAGRMVRVEDLPRLPYTRMVIDEVLRLYPPAYAMARWCNGADVIGGYDMPANTALTISPYITHRLPEFWDNPDQFDPERFTPERVAERPRYAYLPFGGGPRQCIGNSFALTEAAVILASVVQRFDWKVATSSPVEMEPMITLRPKGGVPMELKVRN